jgi:chorismate mutase
MDKNKNIIKAIEEIRDHIDQIDQEILILLTRRMELAKHMGDVKQMFKMKVEDQGRERDIIERLKELSNDSLTKDQINKIFTEIFKSSKKNQQV